MSELLIVALVVAVAVAGWRAVRRPRPPRRGPNLPPDGLSPLRHRSVSDDRR